MNKSKIASSNNKYNENKISSHFYNRTVHEKSKETIDNLHKYKSSKKVSVLLGDYYEQMAIIYSMVLINIKSIKISSKL